MADAAYEQILLVANFRDRGEGNAVEAKEMEKILKGHERCCCTRTSMLNDFGLENARDFLKVPFSCMRHSQAHRQLKTFGEIMVKQRDRLDAHADTVLADAYFPCKHSTSRCVFPTQIRY